MNFKPSKLVTYIENCTSAEILRSLAKRYGHNYDVMRAILLNEFVPVDVLEAQRPIHPELVHENPISLVLECLGRHGSGPELLGIRAEDLNKYHRVLHVIKEALSSPKDFRKYGATLELKALLSRKDLTLAQKLGLCGAEGANPRYRGRLKAFSMYINSKQ